jgi:predicted nucleotidyltransferase
MKSNTARELINDFTEQIKTVLGDELIGVYLYGSLAYGDFNPESSDIDLMVVVKHQLSKTVLEKVDKIHQQIGIKFPVWKARIEISYTPQYFLTSDQPPAEPRPYFGEYKFYRKAPYGNEWIINLYLLQRYGKVLFGPVFSSLRAIVNINAVQEACRKDLIQEWVPKMDDYQWLSNPHYQSYLVLNLSRILNTLETGTLLSKKQSARYVRSAYPQWEELIAAAEMWKYGDKFDRVGQTREFLRFVVSRTKLL